ncbi:MAG: protein kinase family protein [Bacteroides sp.]|nr:protein kinase family protein [Bacteroides sp.]
MPSISEILDSISIPTLIKDEVIKNGSFQKTNRGVSYYTGGFTVVFPVDVKGHKWAFRCWHTEMGNVRHRFKVVSDYINQLQSDYLCNFFYCDSGLVVDGKIFPTTRMDWVDGEPINQYLIRNANNSDALLSLANEFLSMIEFLHLKHIAHGDLQHGNIIVTPSGKIKLVDYDSMFVPGLDGEPDIIIGKAEFQHPNRNNLKITSEKLDYFSELVIYLSILATAYKPTLINKYSIEDSLLFQANDWIDFENSAIYKSLQSIRNSDISLLLDILNRYLQESDIINLTPFPVLLKQLQKEPIIHSFTCGDVDGIAFRGLDTTITLDVENADKITLNSQQLSPDQKEHRMTFHNDTNLVLVIKNGLHTIEEQKHIKVIDPPEIKLDADKMILRKMDNHIEPTNLKWSVSNAHSVLLRCGNNTLSTDESSDGLTINPSNDSIYEIIAIGQNGKTEFKSEITILVRTPSKIEFYADKTFTLPSVPITIHWTTYNAKSVKLNGKKIPPKGQSVFYPESDQKFTLSVTDDFGKTFKTVDVRMLPLPIVSNMMVALPDITQTINIQHKTPCFEAIPDVPKVNSTFIQLEVPIIPDLKAAGVFVSPDNSIQPKLTNRISRFIKRIFK